MSAGSAESLGGDHGLCGVYYAVVTANKDDEASVARIKVRYPWMPDGDRDESHWATLCVPMAGMEYGTYWVPEVEDQVLVMFIAGDIRHPVVIGGAWNNNEKPPETNEGAKNDFRVLKSRSGHRMILDDSAETKVVLVDKDDQNSLTVGAYESGGGGPNAFKASLPGGMASEPKKGVSIAADKGGAKLHVWCSGGALNIDAGSDVEVSAKTKMELKGNTVSAKGSSKAIAAGAVVNVQGMPITFG